MDPHLDCGDEQAQGARGKRVAKDTYIFWPFKFIKKFYLLLYKYVGYKIYKNPVCIYTVYT